jgi:phosphatidylinositol 4-kinase
MIRDERMMFQAPRSSFRSPADPSDSKLDCFTLFGDQTSAHLRERFALGLTTSAVDAYLERLIVTSTGSNYTRLYDTFQYYR